MSKIESHRSSLTLADAAQEVVVQLGNVGLLQPRDIVTTLLERLVVS